MALEAVEKALIEGPPPVCVLHEIVHNEHVVGSLRQRGVRFIESPKEAPPGSTLVFSAHGVSKAVEEEARSLALKVVDATCPLVKAVHRKAVQLELEKSAIILIGHKAHREMVGVIGRLSEPPLVVESLKDVASGDFAPPQGRCACLTQTTLSEDDVSGIIAALKSRIPALRVAGGVCYATRDRQAAVKALAKSCDTIIVVGSAKSSNSKRLREVAEAAGAKACLVASPEELPQELIDSANSIGVTAGASAPESLVEATLKLLKSKGFAFGGETGPSPL